MSELNLTAGDDVYTHPADQPWVSIYGREGNDRITLYSGSNVVGGPGNDVIINLTPGGHGGLGYWDSPGPITLDLEAGYALEAWGGRDTVSGFAHAHTPGHDGDLVLGSARDDDIFVNGFNWAQRGAPARATLDLRGGVDRVTLPGLAPQQAVITTTSDGRSITISAKNYTVTLANVENLRLIELPADYDWARRIERDFRALDLIDFSRVGPDTLLAPGQAGWGSTITYSFMTAAPVYGGAEGGTGFVAPTVAYQDAVRAVLAKLGTQLNVSFAEVGDGPAGYGQLRFGANQQTATKGYAFVPGTVANDRAGDVWLDVETLSVLQPGQEGWQVLLHELGHALGLSHPIDEGTDTTATVLLDAWNHNGFTVMSPNQATSGLWQSWFGPLDLQALQRLYGAREQVSNPGNDFHHLVDNVGSSLSSLRDVGGFDILDASTLSVGAYLDLKPGGYCSVGLTSRGTASVDNLFIEPGSVIEAAIGTSFDDVLLGNDGVNFFLPGSGNDWVEGRGGFDTVLFATTRTSNRIERLADGSGAWVVSDVAGSVGADTLLGISRLYFSDRRVALDIDGRAGEAARIAATVFGAGGLLDPSAVGLVLGALDAGASSRGAYEQAIASDRFRTLAGGADDLAFIRQMFRNLLAVEATDAVAQSFVDGFLSTGAYTQASFAQAVSSLAPVDLVGLAGTGLDYL